MEAINDRPILSSQEKWDLAKTEYKESILLYFSEHHGDTIDRETLRTVVTGIETRDPRFLDRDTSYKLETCGEAITDLHFQGVLEMPREFEFRVTQH
jgi:hypothetical protein